MLKKFRLLVLSNNQDENNICLLLKKGCGERDRWRDRWRDRVRDAEENVIP